MKTGTERTGMPMDPQMERREVIGRRVARGWSLLYFALIVLVSLVPSRLNLQPDYVHRQLHRFFLSFFDVRLAYHDLRDLATNYLLYLPLGLIVPWTLRQISRNRWRWAALFYGSLLSLAMETIQTMTNRYPNVWDLITNSLGYLNGYLLMAGIIHHYGLSPSVFLGSRGGTSRGTLAGALRVLYLSFYVILSLLPYNISVSMAMIWGKMIGSRSGRIMLFLNPLQPWPADRIHGFLMVFCLLIPYGFLSQLRRGERGLNAVWRYALWGAFLAGMVELAQIFVIARVTDLMACLAGGLGAAAGVMLARIWLHLLPAEHHDLPEGPGPAPASSPFILLLLAWVYSFWLVFLNFRPFRFLPSWAEATHKLRYESNWLPLRDYISRRSLADFRDMGVEIGWYVPLGMLLGAWVLRQFPRLPGLARLILVLMLIGLLGLALELGQCITVDRTVDLTDAFSHALGGLIGFLLANLWRPAPRRADAVPAVPDQDDQSPAQE